MPVAPLLFPITTSSPVDPVATATVPPVWFTVPAPEYPMARPPAAVITAESRTLSVPMPLDALPIVRNAPVPVTTLLALNAFSVPVPASPTISPPVDVLAVSDAEPDRLYVPTPVEALPTIASPVEVRLYAGWFRTPASTSPTLMPV